MSSILNPWADQFGRQFCVHDSQIHWLLIIDYLLQDDWKVEGEVVLSSEHHLLEGNRTRFPEWFSFLSPESILNQGHVGEWDGKGNMEFGKFSHEFMISSWKGFGNKGFVWK